MKRIILVIVSLFIVGSFFAIDRVVGSYKKNTKPIIVNVNEQQVEFPDEQPFINKDSRTMIPLRFIVEHLNGEVHWDKETKSVHILQNDIVITLPISSKTVTVNDQVVELDTEAVIHQGRTFVPIRFVATVLGGQVDWNSKDMKVGIIYNNAASKEEGNKSEDKGHDNSNIISSGGNSNTSTNESSNNKIVSIKNPTEVVAGPDKGIETITAYRNGDLVQVLDYVLPENNYRGSAFWYTVDSDIIESELAFHVVYKQYVDGVPMTFDDPTDYVSQALEAKFGSSVANQVVSDLNTGVPSGNVIQQSPSGHGFVETIDIGSHTIQINYVDYKEDYHLKHADINVIKNTL